MHSWLQGFAYRINIGVAVFNISFQAIKDAVANPVKSLKSE
jgi:hypothetical protein